MNIIYVLFILLISLTAKSACPDVSAVLNTNFTTACGSGTIVLTNNSNGTNASTATYIWLVNNSPFDTTTGFTSPFSLFLNTPFTYDFSLVAIDPISSCRDTVHAIVTIYAQPTANITGDDGDGDTKYCFVPGDTVTHDIVTFTNSSSGGNNYSWNFGDGTPVINTATASNVTHHYTVNGTYWAYMTVSNAAGCTALDSVKVVFEKNYTASFTIPPSQYSGCTPLSVTPVNSSLNTYNFTWNWGDGQSTTVSTYSAPTHIYTTVGNFNITLTASNDCGSKTSTLGPINVINGPVADFTTNLTNDHGCSRATVSFTNNSQFVSPSNNYQWNFGNGATAINIKNPSAQNYYAGTYNIQLIAGNNCGKDTLIKTIYIDTIPHAVFNTSSITGCTPMNVSVSDASTGSSLTYKWYIDGVLTYTTASIPVQVFTAPAGTATQTHTIKLQVSNLCGTDDTTVTYTVNPAVDAVFTTNPASAIICEGSSVVFSQSSKGNNLSFSWVFGNGNTASTAGPHSQAYNTPGTVSAMLVVSGTCGIDTQTVSINVKPFPVANFTLSDTIICLNVPVTITNNSTTGANYLWNFGVNATPLSSTAYNPPAVSYSALGLKRIIHSVNLGGCVKRDTVFVRVKPKPVVNFTTNTGSGCSPLSVTFTNTSTYSSDDTFNWNFANGNTGNSSGPYNQVYASTTYTTVYPYLVITAAPNNCSDSIAKPLTLLPMPVASFSDNNDTVCVQNSIAFTNNSTGAGGYTWNFGDGILSNLTSLTHIYNAPGTYSVQLTATNSYGCTDDSVRTILVNDKPIADFTATTVCFEDSTVFTDLSTNSPFNWIWDFNDGNNSLSQNPSHLFSAPGTYTVKLVASSGSCKDSITYPVTVKALPVVNFGANGFCAGQPTSFIDSTTGTITQWEWHFGDSESDYVQDPVHIYTNAGLYNVYLYATNNQQCTDTLIKEIQINALPQVSFSADTVCKGSSMTFINQTTGASFYLWNFNDGSAIDTNATPTHVFYSAGNHTVQLVAESNMACADTGYLQVLVLTSPDAAFDASSVCYGINTLFADSSQNAISWTWNFGDGDTLSGTQNPVHVYNASGNYTVTLNAGFGFGCSDTVMKVITVHPVPVPDFSLNNLCEKQTVSVTDNTSGNPVSWNWDFGDGTPSDTTSAPVHYFNVFGNYNVSLIAANSFGCSDTITKTITVNPLPNMAFSHDTTCRGLAINFSNSTTGAANFTWAFGDGITDTSINVNHIYYTADTFNAMLIAASSDNCTDTLIQQVTVLPQPQAQFAANTVCEGNATVFSDTSSVELFWVWDFGDGTGDGSQSPQHNYAFDGTYQASLIAFYPYGCSDTVAQTVYVKNKPEAGFVYQPVCSGHSTAFADTTFGSPTQWWWDFGDGTPIDTLKNPIHTFSFNAAGSIITLSVGNFAGCYDTVSIPVTIYTLPNVDFYADSSCLGTATNFTNLSNDSVSISQYLWDFGDGNNSFSAAPSYIYQDPGNYTVNLTVTNAHGCDSSISKTIFVMSVPSAGFTADTVCRGLATTFTDTSGNSGLQWFWNFGDGTNDTIGPVMTHQYANGGTYVATLTVSDGASGCFGTSFNYVQVLNSVTADFTSVDSSCVNSLVAFTDNSSASAGSISNYNWSFGDNTSATQQNPSHAYSDDSTFLVSLIVSNSQGCSDSTGKYIKINSTPVAYFNFDNPCEDTPMAFVDSSSISSGIINSWSWNFGDGNISTQQNPGHTYVSPSLYSVSLTVTSALGCSDNYSRQLTVYPNPNASFSYIKSCYNTPTYFGNQSSINGDVISEYLWDFGDGTTDTLIVPAHQFATSQDSFMVSLVTISSNGCADTTKKYVSVFPVVHFNYAPENASGCNPYTSQFNDLSSICCGSVITYWDWNFGDGYHSYETNPAHQYTVVGEYPIILTLSTSDNCTYTDTLSYPVIVHPQPVANFDPVPLETDIYNSQIEFLDLSYNASSWYWTFDTLSYSTQQNPAFAFPDSGTFTITQIATNIYQCADTIRKTVRINPLFSFYIPNAFTPNDDGKNEFYGPKVYGIKDYVMKIYNSWGQMIFSTNDPDKGWEGKVNDKYVEPDVYLYDIIVNDFDGIEHKYRGTFTLVR